MNDTITQIYSNQFINDFGFDEFHKIIQTFRTKANKEGLTAAEHILYNAVRNLPLKRGFSPIKNKVKLANGQYEMEAFDRAFSSISYNLNYHFKTIANQFNLPDVSQSYWLSKLKE